MKTRTYLISSILILSALFIACFNSYGKTIVVPDEYPLIQDAINVSSAHDTILVKAGSYHEFLVLKDSIVLMSEGTENANWERAMRTTIHSEGLRDTAGKIPPVINSADGAVIDGFEITGMDSVNHHLPGHSHAVQNRGTSSTIINCVVHDNGSTGIGSHEKDGRPSTPTIIHNKVYRNFGIGIGFNQLAKGIAKKNISFNNREVGIGIQNGAAPLVEDNVVYGNGWNGISVREGSKPIVRNNVSYSNGTDRTGSEMPVGSGVGIGADSTGWTVKQGDTIGALVIEGNTVYDNPSGGIMCRNNSLVEIKGNTSYDNSGFQIAINDSSLGLVDSNYVYQSPQSKYQCGGIVVASKGGATIKNNRISKVESLAIAVSEAIQTEVSYNTIDSCKLIAIRVDSSNFPVNVNHNLLKDNKSVGIFVTSGTADISHNLLINNASGGISSDEFSVSHIHNNTVFKNDTAGRGIFVANKNSKIVNNIVYGYTLGIFISNGPVIDYNCTFQNKAINGPPSSAGQNAMEKDPEFVAPAAYDFHLKSSSPCIDRGDPDTLYNDDNYTRSDIGCYPYNTPESVVNYFCDSHTSFKLYPTKSPKQFLIIYTDDKIQNQTFNIVVYDLYGVPVDRLKINGNEVLWNAGHLPSGAYFLRLEEQKNNSVLKVFIGN